MTVWRRIVRRAFMGLVKLPRWARFPIASTSFALWLARERYGLGPRAAGFVCMTAMLPEMTPAEIAFWVMPDPQPVPREDTVRLWLARTGTPRTGGAS